jgi:hydroxyethylthiazole kinase-like uncharacterized protein yjeF
MTDRDATSARLLRPKRLREMPLPTPSGDDDKEARGRVLVVGGGRQNPGALTLAGTAALRAGAGKLRLATSRSVAVAIGVALPEARVFALPEGDDGEIDPAAAAEVARLAAGVDALVLGPGMTDPERAAEFARAVLEHVDGPSVALDAGALGCLGRDRDALHRLGGRAVVTPHAGEMAAILGIAREDVERDPLAIARKAADELRAVVALKGPETFIAAPGGEAVRFVSGRVGLATSGSGDVLAGIVGGLLARGADPLRAAAWAVYLHGQAGNRAGRRHGRIGYLAREIAAEIPRLMERME